MTRYSLLCAESVVKHQQNKQTNLLFPVFVTSAKEVMFSLAFVCLFVSRIMQKLLRRFSQHSVELWQMGKVRDD